MKEKDYIAWLNGLYIKDAVLSVMDGKKFKYPDEPMSLREEKEELSPEDKFLAWIDVYNANYDLNNRNVE